MSNEDDEVILEGNPLYNYMQEIGVQQLDEISVAKTNSALPATKELQSSGFDVSYVVSEHACRLLKLIFNSHLMFDDDFNFVSSCVPETTVQSNRYRCGCIAMTAAAALNIGIILFNKYTVSSLLKNLSIIPSCLITIGSMGYVSKLIFDHYKERRIEKDLNNHIKILQKFYKLLQRIICDIREIDMVTRGSGLRIQPSGDRDHKLFVPLAKFRIAVVTALIEIGKTMSNGFISLRELIPETVKQTDFAITSTRNLLPDNIMFDETKMSVSDLNNMNHIYQLVQSEYLSWLALCYCPMQPKNESVTKNVCVKVMDSVHSVVLKCYCELNFQHVVSLHGRRSDGMSVEKQKVASRSHVDVLTDGVHNIMIHLVSLMEEVKRLESSLHISSSLVYEGTQSAEDSLKLFAIKFNEFKIKLQNANDHILKMDTDLKKRITTISSSSPVETNSEKYSKEHLSGLSVGASAFELTGKSDFSVRGEHEVFIGTSCNDTYVATDSGEEYAFERRQLMPNVLSELKTALRPVYEMHAERERQALLRTGKSCLETVAEEESSVNASECSSDIKDTDEINSLRLINIEVAEAVLDNPHSNFVTLCNTCISAETERNVSASRYDTANLNISSSADCPVSMNVSCITEVSGETIGEIVNHLPASNSEAGASTMIPSVVSASITEVNTAIDTKSPAVDVTAESWTDSNEDSISLPHSATSHVMYPSSILLGHAPSDNPDSTSPVDVMLRNMGDIDQKSEIHETLLSQILSQQKTLVEEQFIYDGDSDTELSD